VVLVIITLIAFLAPHFSQFSPTTPYPNQSNLAPGTNGHWFGTDNLGRDIFVRVAAGTSVSLRVALVAMAIDLVIGTSYGLISGYFGGKIDLFMQRITEILSTMLQVQMAIGLVRII